MARSSRSKGSVSVDLFNLPTLPDERRVATSYLDIPVNFYLPDGKNSKISKIISRQSFERQTPDGNEGFVIEIQYLRRAFGTKTYLIDKVTGSLFALHDDHIESMGFCGSECVFDLQDLPGSLPGWGIMIFFSSQGKQTVRAIYCHCDNLSHI